ncbi:MAG: PadR family transcriptional regulator [Anaerolineales bacterium]|nr:PadR family transcriptional regulator [Anaerolineales bacterium]
MMTNAELAILSLLVEKPLHGYQIEQVIEEREMRNWTEVGFSSIYYILKKLEGKGHIRGQIERSTGQGPARKVYYITPPGFQAWREATMQALSTPITPHSSFLLGLSNLTGIPAEDALFALRQYRISMVERAENLRSRWEAIEDHLPFNVNALFDFSMTMIDAELSWVTGFIHQLELREEQSYGKD